jgi:Peptidase family M23
MKFVARFAFVVACVCVLPNGATAGALGIAGGWSRPVGGAVVRGFDPPETPFGAGHVGVDFAARPGSPVRAAGAGVVLFAGRVGAGLHVVVRHDGEVRTSYSFLASIAVVTGEAVEQGALVGTTGGSGPAHGTGVLHFGVRVGATYIDPMRLLAPVDLAAVVHLAAPHGGPAGPLESKPAEAPPAGERAALVAAIRADARPAPRLPAWWDEVGVEPRAVEPPAEPGPGAITPGETAHAATSRNGPAAVVAAAAALSVTGLTAGLASRRRRRAVRGS